jgi:hypothetical protein
MMWMWVRARRVRARVQRHRRFPGRGVVGLFVLFAVSIDHESQTADEHDCCNAANHDTSDGPV